jgi:hypothetical protein
MRRQLAQLPLHTGAAPAYLFGRMWRLAGAITMAVVDEYGPQEMLRRLANPWWFQAFGCVLGFDWHSSGVTTVTCGAMKEAYKHFGNDLGIHVAGGKGGTSRKTPGEIANVADRYSITSGQRLVFASRMSAKVDSAAVQDGYDLYHHSFFFTTEGDWCVVQQGMNDVNRFARRYHWLAESVDDFACEPHSAIDDLSASFNRGACAARPGEQLLLNMVASEADRNRAASVDLIGWNPDKLMFELRRMTEGPTLFAPAHHEVLPEDVNVDRLERIVRATHEERPPDFSTLLGAKGVGPATVRALSLLAELIYDAPASHKDPAAAIASKSWADYSYAHGGKDGTPHPVDRPTYDTSIKVLTDAVRKARVGETDKRDALKRLATFARGV